MLDMRRELSSWQPSSWLPPALAQSVDEKTGVNSTLGISPTTPDYVKEVAISDMFELQSNKLGAERGNAAEKTWEGQTGPVTRRSAPRTRKSIRR
jgi:hypothetical protein